MTRNIFRRPKDVETKTVKFLRHIKAKMKLTTQAELAEVLQLDKSLLSHYIHGSRIPGYQTCLLIKSQLAKHGIEVQMSQIR